MSKNNMVLLYNKQITLKELSAAMDRRKSEQLRTCQMKDIVEWKVL